ncbi:MmcQ/YjbR family DNA-binding protein [Actinomadura sp. GTD37]|uniref:MmcQ/YjbR family DNA-binding protein n=1 Tax=Actinomadura sp. GTD37 TaxID=1778030 RepID=UPI0035C195EB
MTASCADAPSGGYGPLCTGRPFTDKLDVYKAEGKVFLIVTDDPREQIITVKVEPDHARSLRRRHESVSPGRYLNKRHWISLGAGPDITANLVKDLVAHSYDLVTASPPARRPKTRAAGH